MRTTNSSQANYFICPYGVGFTLVEMAISLTIIAILITGALTLTSGLSSAKQIALTRTLLEETQEAILAFALTHKRLPCPAELSATDPTQQGVESFDSSTSACRTQRGFLPWKSLGLNGTDAWDKRVMYLASRNFTNTAQIRLSDEGQISVLEHCSTADKPIVQETTVAFAVWSLGPNMHFGIDRTGNKVAALSPGDADEACNQPTPDTSHIRHVVYNPTRANGFDDIVSWTSRYTLFARLLAAGLPPTP